ncbi:DNA polymerase III, alpha subunit [Elusimicrobium minutum Pei191]|uniref:DNA polymerase III subunit alpha n=1 Tax=Elusimicrobium minutum (strain Pei191) TaxID=445932 RepID=B2KB15_ELUMP|nr:DNA polymerase III subunit alpha [Elusimicrobium minutum]ACC97774.1 DNA polymerase III, alpha subunit [Elusimicrobium minutum Pei191]
MEFVHLHNHSEYSLLDGMLRLSEKGPSKFLKQVAADGFKAMAITDHGNMYGAMDFYKNAAAAGIKPIIGCEAYITNGSHKNKEKGLDKTFHLTLLAKDYEGYQNLMALISKAWLDGFYYHPRIDKDILAQHAKGIMALSGCLKGEVSQELLNGTFAQACEYAKTYESILGKGNYYIELMDHGIEEEQIILPKLIEVSKSTGIPVVATNDCHYEKQEDWQAHDIHMCISMGKTLDDPNRLKSSTHELYFKSAQEMAELFSYIPEAVSNTLEVAEKCNVVMPKSGFVLPVFDIPPSFSDTDSYIKNLCQEGLAKKMSGIIPPNYQERLDYELGVIGKMGFSSYFLIVADFIDYARQNHIPVGPGRGSGAGSIVAYSLNITKVDPIKNGLLFERFLNPDRLSMPDLDIDFSDEGREQVINYVRNKYGETNVAQIITFGTMKAKMAVKDVARVLNIPVSESNRITKLIPNDLGTTIDSAIETVKELKQEIASNPQTAKLFDFAKKLEGLKRHAGIHAAGIVVTREEVSKYAPLARGSKEAITTQYEGGILADDLGLLKIDFLGLRTLTIIDNAVDIIKNMRGIDIDIDNIPLDNKKTYELLSSAKTLGIFQLESGGMRDLVKRLKPSEFSDISALVALYRPGPMESGMLESFVRRKAGQEKITYDTPLMEPVLKETYGTMVYQEQIMELSKLLGGFTPGQADSLRKAMGKKKVDEMEKARVNFVNGCAGKKINPKTADKIFEQMSKFAGYGFNKSHSVAYALVSYQTAYLKANYPIEFMCSLLTNEIGHNAIGSDDKENKIVTYIEEAKKMGFETLGPDVNHSKENFSIEEVNGKEIIRFGLEAVKNVGTEAAASIVSARGDRPYCGFQDLLERIDLKASNKKTIESLIKAGALDSLIPGKTPNSARAVMLAEMEDMLEITAKIKEEKESSICSLFGEDSSAFVSVKKKETKTAPRPLKQEQLLEMEKEVLGFYNSGHPLAKYKKHMDKIKSVTIEEINENNIKGAVNILGIITRVKKRQNKRKEDWAQFIIEDETGQMSANAYSRVYAEIAEKIENNAIVYLTGDIKTDEESARTEIMVSNIESIIPVISRAAAKVTIDIPKGYSETNSRLLNTLLERGKGITEVYFNIESPDEDKAPFLVRSQHKIVLHKALIDHIENTLGENSWTFEK